ncbi:sulfatase-like hydrolase/transferase [Stieleria varia]|uniref:Arylsulfatase n=1 Tax=Stieleria varia TaxID=2528005 RepID=A0A5C6B7F9_9BACT|nr:sulfatase-like hydrolase/transferase [Stieleria varia]TWU07737.1 Arylsulfatase [Stieleria varia]
MNRSPLAIALAFLCLPLVLSNGVHAADPPKPNVLLILADDLGFSDLGCYGGEINTPNLDSLAENGLRFTQFYNTARCWPTRGSLMTGYYAQQIRRDTVPGIPSGGNGVRPDWAVLVPRMLQEVGYRSYHTGKWHIDGMPLENGFDRSYYWKDQGRFFNPTKHWRDDVALPPVAKNSGFYATTAAADHAIDVLAEHARDHADQPFFHYLAFAAPHFPLQALPEDIAHYSDTYTIGWDAIRQQRWQKMRQMGLLDAVGVTELSRVERDLGPPYHFPDAFEKLGDGEINRPVPWKELTDSQKAFQSQKMAIHAAMIHRMDIEIGRVFEQIKSMGQWDNTIVMFLSDNGASAEIMVRDDGHDPNAPMGSAETYLCLGPGWSTACNTPFRRHKTWTHEGGCSTPLLVSWPNGIKAAGEFRNSPGHVIDVVPTLLDLSGASRPFRAPAAPGKSIVPAFEKETDLGHDELWWFHDGHKAIQVGKWKAVAPIAEPWELYDLSNDRDESNDLAVIHADKLNELVSRWEQRMAEHTELATQDLPAKVRSNVRSGVTSQNPVMKKAQDDARPKRSQVLLGGENKMIAGRHAFLMKPTAAADTDDGKPWIFYGPTLSRYPDQAESWMHQQFLDAGVAVAGIDVGEMYGSPLALPFFDALYDDMVAQGYSRRPALLGRSRGGLWVSSWALSHPDRVAAIGGIYPVYDYTTYPGAQRAATAYGKTPEELMAQQDQLNPVKRLGKLSEAKIPVLIIHGTNDQVVPIEQNSEALVAAYRENNAADLVQLIKADGQGHSFWEGFFHSQELVDFLIDQANAREGARLRK